ncbi:MAG: type II CRISPR RNA-guided endonuclease Cas9 [Methylophilaceae bacterium]|nr:type II CRISPR RNA-guided endonuclease Cas9 [Methylophilaceae bacterium]
MEIQNNLTFGLDIGMASVGWAVLNEQRIIDLGVRCFDKAETDKEGESLNLARRSARLMRRRLRRRAWRLTKLARLLKRQGLIDDVNLFKQPPGFATNLWQLRVDALQRCLGAEEWARVIYHLCKHRGFHWLSKAEEKKAETDSAGESGKVKKGLAATTRLMQEKGYQTVAQMVLAEFPESQRNKDGEYSKALSRVLLSQEFKHLFQHQCQFGNLYASQELESRLLDRKTGLFWAQKPALAGLDLLKMLGHCTLEKTEYRAPKASFSVERHVWLTRLNNLRIVVDGRTRALTASEQQATLLLPYNQASDLTYKQLGAALIKAGLLVKDCFTFAGLSYPSPAQKAAGNTKDPEAERLVKMPGWQALRETFTKAGLDGDWGKLSVAALQGNARPLDDIAWVLSVYKEDEEVARELAGLGLSPEAIKALQMVRFEQFGNLSLKALYNILPHMADGLRYDEACAKAGYHHSQLHKAGAGEFKYLPPLYLTTKGKDKRPKFNNDIDDIPRNPVVLRALNQARKVVNALIKRYGSPSVVHIELARDLSHPFDERRRIKREQETYRENNEAVKARFAEQFGSHPKGAEFEKWRLYSEQCGKCAYSLQPLDINRLLETGYVEIDHILPYSRSFDDSKNNKVLVLTTENRNKGNRTPYEYLGGQENSLRWREFEAYVSGNKSYRQVKRNRLLKKDFGEAEAKDFSERNLNDTRYICRFFKNYVERYLKLDETSEAKRCVVVSGQLTNFLRTRWGLIKVRADSDRHHALDAVVVAACSHSMVKRLSDYSRRKELEKAREGLVDVTTGEIVNLAMLQQLEAHFPAPWSHFRHELETRLHRDDVTLLREELARFGTYSEADLAVIKPLFVSRAPQRRNGGAAHKDTIYGQPERLKTSGGVTQKVAVASLSVKDFGENVGGEWQDCKLIDPHRNEKLYAVLKAWVAGKEMREKRAKEIEASLGRGKEKRQPSAAEKYELEHLRTLPRKPSNTSDLGPIVRKVTTVIDKLSGIPIRGGVAKNDTMLRTDVFSKNSKFYLVPVYVHHRVTGLPNRAIVAGADEADWTLIDDSFAFLFSLYPNDLVRVQQKNKPLLEGYYSSCHRGTASLTIWVHDRNQSIGKDGMIGSIGVKTALSLEKFNVDVLGRVYPAPPEVRRGLA